MNKKFKLMLGDNIESLKKLPDNSIDSIVTDPPYGLSFMNKKWDYDVPSVNFWKEVYRVLKPGGHILSFGGTRTYHRMVVNIEDAGFEIRDQIQWLYGCLDDKTEILTDSGWKKYTEINLNDKALSWNSELNILEFNKIDDIIIKEYKGDMVLLKNKHTEQILTPNHRVYHKYERKDRGYLGEKWEVIKSGDMKKSGIYTLPLASYYEGEGIGGEDYAALLGWIWSEGEFDKKSNTIRISQSSINQPLVNEIKDLIEILNIKYSHYTRERLYNYKHKGIQPYIENYFYFSTENDINNKIRTDLDNKKLNFNLVKKMTIKEKIAFLDAAHKGDGSKGRQVIYQNDLSQLELLQFMYLTIGKSSYFNLNKMSINFRNKETTQLQHKNLNKKVYYEGDVWCVRVKNSAFVARRGDKVFITGNSGFPKSLNIGKGVDKKFGNSEWEGWGTGLKPANEPIVLARKPISEKTIVDNVIKWGTGGINIDGCRISSSKEDLESMKRKDFINKTITIDSVFKKNTSKMIIQDKKSIEIGRFPANVILDEEAGRLLDEQSGFSKSNTTKKIVDKGAGIFQDEQGNQLSGHKQKVYPNTINDEGGASRFFYQAKVSKKERNLGLDGFEDKEVKKTFDDCYNHNINDIHNKITKNNHPTLKPINLMTYLCRLITPPNGIVLYPFMGSGSTGISALLEGFRFIGMELDEGYFKIAERRITEYEQYRKLLKN